MESLSASISSNPLNLYIYYNRKYNKTNSDILIVLIDKCIELDQLEDSEVDFLYSAH